MQIGGCAIAWIVGEPDVSMLRPWPYLSKLQIIFVQIANVFVQIANVFV